MTMPCTTRTLARQARPSRSTSFPGAATVAALVLFLGLSATTCVAATTSGVRVSQSRREASRSGPSADAEQAPRARDPARIATLVPLVGARTPNTATRVAEPRKPVSFDSNEGASLSFDEVPSSFIYDNASARSSPIQARIINGDEVNPPGLYPWMVAIVGVRVTAGQETESFWCGGTIISPGYVMSASHCFFSNAGSENTNFAFFRVKVGAHDINDPEIMNVDVDEILGHPKYAGATFENDVAILRLATSLDPVKYPPARLSWQIEDYRQGANTIVMGWGKNENNNLNQNLHQASVPTVSLETCTSAGSYPGPPETTLTVKDTMLCAGVLAGGLDACQVRNFPVERVPPAPYRLRVFVLSEGTVIPYDCLRNTHHDRLTLSGFTLAGRQRRPPARGGRQHR